jgi:vancomycin resistance protein YoaR
VEFKELSAMLKQIRAYWMGLLLIPLILGATIFTLYTYGSKQILPPNLTVSGWKVGGMPCAQFEVQLHEKLKRLAEQKVFLHSSSKEVESNQLTLGQLGLAVDDNKLVLAREQLCKGSILQRVWHRWQMRNESLELTFRFRREHLAQTLNLNWQELYARQTISAKRVILANDDIHYEPEHIAQRIELKELTERLTTHTSIGSLDTENPFLIELPLYEQLPPVTIQSLKAQGIDRKIVEFTTEYAGSGEGRIHNIRSTAAVVQDMLLKPGEIFDFGKVIQKTSSLYGYKEAPVIVNGKLVPGVGGGICQVSTTLYNAVLRSGLEVLERRNHTIPIRYIPLGQDATFAEGYINFSFRNNTQHYLLIRTSATEQKLTVKLFGDIPRSVTYDVQSSIVQTLDPPVQYVHNATITPGSSVKLLDGKPGYLVDTFRYTKHNGTLIQKELISRDRYAPEPTLIATNHVPLEQAPQTDKPKIPSVVEDGVSGPIFH